MKTTVVYSQRLENIEPLAAFVRLQFRGVWAKMAINLV